jgi:hypothetical protein
MQAHCISGPCHPPQVGGGFGVIVDYKGSLKLKAKVLNGSIKSRTKLLWN